MLLQFVKAMASVSNATTTKTPITTAGAKNRNMFHTSCRMTFAILHAVLFASALAFRDQAAPPQPNTTAFNPIFNSPSHSGPADNMPVGNGEVVGNIYVDSVNNGSLAILLGRSDVFTGEVQPLKLGRVRIGFQPNPFIPVCEKGFYYTRHVGYIGDQHAFIDKEYQCKSAATCPAEAEVRCNSLPDCESFAIDPDWNGGAVAQTYSKGLADAGANPAWTLWTRQCNATSTFKQELDLSTASVNITAGLQDAVVKIRIWSDILAIGSADSIHVEVSSSVATTVSVYIDAWRTKAFSQSTKSTARGPCESTVVVEPDTIADSEEGLLWYRFNNKSSFNKTMSDQMLGHLAQTMTDPLQGRTSGALVVAHSGDHLAFVAQNTSHMQSSSPNKAHTITIYTHTAVGCQSPQEFTQQIHSRAVSSTPPRAAWNNHSQWWSQFWSRSWVVLKADPGKSQSPKTAFAVTEAYYLNRYLTAIQSRGTFPMHHNGGTVTWGWDGESHANPDARGWGGGYWFQNVRHSYWYMFTSGDTDLLDPLFGMYKGQLPVLEGRGRTWWKLNQSALAFAETSYFFGTYEPVDYGCGRSGEPDISNPYIRHHYEGGVELAVMMLQAYQHTHDASLVSRWILPWCESLLRFYDQHYPKYPNGTLYLQHAQSCETWPDCTNPAAQAHMRHTSQLFLLVLEYTLTHLQSASYVGKRAASHCTRTSRASSLPRQ